MALNPRENVTFCRVAICRIFWHGMCLNEFICLTENQQNQGLETG